MPTIEGMPASRNRYGFSSFAEAEGGSAAAGGDFFSDFMRISFGFDSKRCFQY
jgi:hypothetical protein